MNDLELEVRAGVHTGECELIGEDVGGLAVHIGARIGAMAGAGEILVSSTVADLVVGSGMSFTERGEHELKGLLPRRERQQPELVAVAVEHLSAQDRPPSPGRVRARHARARSRKGRDPGSGPSVDDSVGPQFETELVCDEFALVIGYPGIAVRAA